MFNNSQGGGGFQGGGGGGGFQGGGGGGGFQGGGFQGGGQQRSQAGRGYQGKNPNPNYKGKGGGGGQQGGGYQGKNPNPNFRGGQQQVQGSNIQDMLLTDNSEPSTYNVCGFFCKNGTCKYGTKCKSNHVIQIAMKIKAHDKPIKTLGVLPGPLVFTGSEDCSIKVWNLESNHLTPTNVIPTNGSVECISIEAGQMGWSVDEELPSCKGNVVGMVYKVDTTTLKTTLAKRSDEMPYTHPLTVRSFEIAVVGIDTFIITGGGEGTIRLWKYNPVSDAFEHIAVMEGHLRAVTCLLLNGSSGGSYLWSGSTDNTIRVWDMSSQTCVAVLGGNENQIGHTEPVSCLKYIPREPINDSLIASGGADGDVILWKCSAPEAVHGCHHDAIVTALEVFQDEEGGQQLLIIGLITGKILLRQSLDLSLLICIDNTIVNNTIIWSIKSLGRSCFATGDASGQLTIWKTNGALGI